MNADFFANNRARLTERLKGGLVVIAAYTAQQSRGDTSFMFEQESNFWYLTGVEHPNWRLVIDGKQERSWLIAPDVDEMHQLFDGSLDFKEAQKVSGINEVLDKKAGEELLFDLAKRHDAVYTLGQPPYGRYVDFSLNPAPGQLRAELKKMFPSVLDCRKELSRLRAIKQPAEIEAMIEAAQLSVEAFQAAKSRLPECRYEYEVEAELAYHFRRHNAVHAFEPIVASGKNACTLHYIQNSNALNSGELLLIDAGARLQGYPADITRTYAVGEPTKRQAAVHEAVRLAERRIIELIRPGLHLKEYLAAVDKIMKEMLVALALMKSIKDEAGYHRYFPHAVSHGLGIDVHDSLGGYEELRPGMVLTVEPGVYIPEEGIGVRIEDNILTTDEGYVNLTAGLSTDL